MHIASYVAKYIIIALIRLLTFFIHYWMMTYTIISTALWKLSVIIVTKILYETKATAITGNSKEYVMKFKIFKLS